MKTLIPTTATVGSYTISQSLNQHAYLGKSKWQIKQDLQHTASQITEFADWLYVLELGLILSFRHQVCVQVGSI